MEHRDERWPAVKQGEWPRRASAETNNRERQRSAATGATTKHRNGQRSRPTRRMRRANAAVDYEGATTRCRDGRRGRHPAGRAAATGKRRDERRGAVAEHRNGGNVEAPRRTKGPAKPAPPTRRARGRDG